MSARRKTSRVVLRLDSFGAPLPSLRAVARLAHAMEAEFAARLVDDSRLADALAFAAQLTPGRQAAPDPGLRHFERSLRRQIEEIALEANAAWSFDVARCAGIIAAECALHADDVLAIALPEVEHMMGMLRGEISHGLERTSGVLLMPRAQPRLSQPIVGVIANDSGLAYVVESSVQLAERFHEPLAFVIVGGLEARARAEIAAHWSGPGAVALHVVPTAQQEILAAYVRNLRPKLVVAAPTAASVEEFLARPRLLREMAAPLLLLRTSNEAGRH